VLGLRYDGRRGTVVALTNLADASCVVDLRTALTDSPRRVLEVFANRHYTTTVHALDELELDASGYRWLRLRT
jgi:hypothetical protein